MSTKKNKVSNKKMYDDVNLTKPRREPKYNALNSYTRMRRKLKIEYLLPGGRVVQARCRILSSLISMVRADSCLHTPASARPPCSWVVKS